MNFADLPLVTSEADARRVHQTPGLFLVNKRGGVAHAFPYDCLHIDPRQTIDQPNWRIATDAECRTLRFRWCESCS